MEESRRERRLVETGTPGVETFMVPWDQSMGNGARVDHIGVWTLDSQELVGFTFTQEILLDSRWQPVARFRWDTDHVVLDMYVAGQEEPQRSERWGGDFETVEDAFEAALRVMYDDVEYEDRTRRYGDGW